MSGEGGGGRRAGPSSVFKQCKVEVNKVNFLSGLTFTSWTYKISFVEDFYPSICIFLQTKDFSSVSYDFMLEHQSSKALTTLISLEKHFRNSLNRAETNISFSFIFQTHGDL